MNSEFGQLAEQAAIIATDVIDAWMAIETKRGALIDLLQRATDAPYPDAGAKASMIATWREMIAHMTTACDALAGRVNSSANEKIAQLENNGLRLNNSSGALPTRSQQ